MGSTFTYRYTNLIIISKVFKLVNSNANHQIALEDGRWESRLGEEQWIICMLPKSSTWVRSNLKPAYHPVWVKNDK